MDKSRATRPGKKGRETASPGGGVKRDRVSNSSLPKVQLLSNITRKSLSPQGRGTKGARQKEKKIATHQALRKAVAKSRKEL